MLLPLKNKFKSWIEAIQQFIFNKVVQSLRNFLPQKLPEEANRKARIWSVLL